MVCPCCGCRSCPDECSFDVDTSVDDDLGTATASVSPDACDTCDDVATNPVEYSGNFVTASAYNSGGGQIGGFGRVDETASAGGTSFSRGNSIVVNVTCVPTSPNVYKRIVEVALAVIQFRSEEPFYAGVGFQKLQALYITYFLEAEIGCADVIDDIVVVADLDEVVINGTSYSWSVIEYVDSCQELDENLDYQPCSDFLTPNVPEVTVSFSKRAGC